MEVGMFPLEFLLVRLQLELRLGGDDGEKRRGWEEEKVKVELHTVPRQPGYSAQLRDKVYEL